MTYTVEVIGPVRTVNATPKGSYYEHARETRQWREAFGWAAKAAKIGTLTHPVRITVHHLRATSRLPDVGACWFAVKAAVDGLVDAKVLTGDSPKYVRSITLLAPEHVGYEGLALDLVEVEE